MELHSEIAVVCCTRIFALSNSQHFGVQWWFVLANVNVQKKSGGKKLVVNVGRTYLHSTCAARMLFKMVWLSSEISMSMKVVAKLFLLDLLSPGRVNTIIVHKYSSPEYYIKSKLNEWIQLWIFMPIVTAVGITHDTKQPRIQIIHSQSSHKINNCTQKLQVCGLFA